MKEMDSWWNENEAEISSAQGKTLEPLPDEPALMDDEQRELCALYARIAYLMAKCKGFVSTAHEVAMRRVRANEPELTAQERVVAVRADKEYILAQYRYDILDMVCSALKDRNMAIANFKNNAMQPGMNR